MAEVLQWGLFLWPYPAVLALQAWGPDPWVIVALHLTGSGLVVSFGIWLRSTFARFFGADPVGARWRRWCGACR